jgi:hypothetical protein
MSDEHLLDFDCILEMLVPDVECVEKMQRDEAFIQEVLPDHFNFADMSRCKYALRSFSIPDASLTALILEVR